MIKSSLKKSETRLSPLGVWFLLFGFQSYLEIDGVDFVTIDALRNVKITEDGNRVDYMEEHVPILCPRDDIMGLIGKTNQRKVDFFLNSKVGTKIDASLLSRIESLQSVTSFTIFTSFLSIVFILSGANALMDENNDSLTLFIIGGSGILLSNGLCALANLSIHSMYEEIEKQLKN